MAQTQTKIPVLAAALPFSGKSVASLAPYGATVEQIVREVMPPRYIGEDVGAVVEIGGKVVPRAMWRRVKPKLGTSVKVNIVPMGGGGKGIIGTILTVAVLVAAPYLGAAALGSFSGLGVGALSSLTVGGVTITSGMVGGAIGAIGMMAISALVPPPKQPTQAASPLSTPTQFIEGAQNALSPWGRVPIVLGTRRMIPPQAAKPFTEAVGDDQYVRQLFTWGYGKVSISDEKIGETSLSAFTGVEKENRLDADLDQGTSLFSNDVDQVSYSVVLEPAGTPTVRTTHEDVDEAIVDITFPQGIFWVRQNGRYDPRTINFLFEFREVGSVGAWTTFADYTITIMQKEALRRSLRAIFPSRSQYDIRVRRVTPGFNSSSTFDQAVLTAIKSVTYTNPVHLAGVSGTAIRIKATDQLNGTVDQYNALVSLRLKSYDEDAETWVDDVISSNPADLYRYVLQSAANANALGDDEINIPDLEQWHIHCTEQGYTFDQIIDGDKSVSQILQDIAAAGSATPAIVDGLRTVVIDKPGKDVVQIVTPRNSWGYQGNMVFTDLPHAFRCQFPNKLNGYLQDERIVYDDGYDANNATMYETLELPATVSSDQAFKMGRRYIATARLRPETHTFNMAIESIYFLRGERVVLEHDVPVVGVGDARVKSVVLDSAGLVVGIHVDDTITIPENNTYYTRIRLADGSFLYKQITVSQGEHTYLPFQEPFERPTTGGPPVDLLNAGDLLLVVQTGTELDLIITRIEPQEDFSAKITAVNYAPEIFDAENAPIPPFSSGVTVPLSFIRPLAPVFINVQSGVESFIVNSDGSYITRAIFTLQNNNPTDVRIGAVKVRLSGTTDFTTAQILESTPERVVIAGLQDGMNYDVQISYQRQTSRLVSDPMVLNGWKFIGASAPPSDVTGFKVQVVDNMLIFDWDKCPDIDYDHAVMKFLDVYSGATWDTAMTLKPTIYDTTVNVPFIGGTYMIKFVDRLGNESTNATAVITYDPAGALNVVQNYQEQPLWAGDHENTQVIAGKLALDDLSLGVGYYTFANLLDLGDVYESRVYGSFQFYADFFQDLFDVEDMFEVDNLFQLAPLNDIFAMPDIFAESDLFGQLGNVAVTLEVRYSLLDPLTSNADWSEWEPLLNGGKRSYRAVQFRLKLETFDGVMSPFVTMAQVTVDMPDRFEKGNDLVCDATIGATIDYLTPFLAIPSTLITIQNGDANDELEFISKTTAGFAFKVFNTTSMTYVTRSYDFLSAGYGRAITNGGSS